MSVITGTDRAQPRIPHRWALFSIAVLGLLSVSLWLRASAPGRGQPVRAAVRPNSMAVLPFINTSPDSSEDYLGHGLAAELTRALNRLAGLRVAARSSAFGLKQPDGDPRIIGRRLNVGTVLQGNVRRSGDRSPGGCRRGLRSLVRDLRADAGGPPRHQG